MDVLDGGRTWWIDRLDGQEGRKGRMSGMYEHDG